MDFSFVKELHLKFLSKTRLKLSVEQEAHMNLL